MPETIRPVQQMTTMTMRGLLFQMKGWRAILAWMLLASLPVDANAVDSSPISAETRVSQREITVGDIVTYSIIVRHEAGIRVAPPDPTPHFKKGFDYVDRGSTGPITVNGQQEQTFWYKFRADRVGFYNFPDIPVAFAAPAPDDPSQTIPGTLQAPKTEIVIRSVLFIDEQAEDIKDIKPIVGSGLNWPKYLEWIFVGLVVLLAAFGFYTWTRSGKKVPAPAVRIPELKPHEIALAELDHLLARKLLERGRFREHYFELSEIFRRYLGKLLSIPALDWTTEEIRDYLSRHRNTDAELQRTILTLLPATDQIKFAKAPVELQTAFNHVEAVRDFIQTTTPEITSKFQVKSPATPLRAGRT